MAYTTLTAPVATRENETGTFKIVVPLLPSAMDTSPADQEPPLTASVPSSVSAIIAAPPHVALVNSRARTSKLALPAGVVPLVVVSVRVDDQSLLLLLRHVPPDENEAETPAGSGVIMSRITPMLLPLPFMFTLTVYMAESPGVTRDGDCVPTEMLWR
jgi:hypothetical protein